MVNFTCNWDIKHNWGLNGKSKQPAGFNCVENRYFSQEVSWWNCRERNSIFTGKLFTFKFSQTQIFFWRCFSTSHFDLNNMFARFDEKVFAYLSVNTFNSWKSKFMQNSNRLQRFSVRHFSSVKMNFSNFSSSCFCSSLLNKKPFIPW